MCDPPISGQGSGSGAGVACAPVGGTAQDCGTYRVDQLVEVGPTEGQGSRAGGAPQRQWINLPEHAEHHDHGRVIYLKAHIATTGPCSPAGQTVYWYFTPGGDNRAGLNSVMRAGLRRAADPASWLHTQMSGTTGADGWTDVVQFHLSRYGGDQFTVAATENGECTGGQSLGPFQGWRRLWCEIDSMRNNPEMNRPTDAACTSYGDITASYRRTDHLRRMQQQLQQNQLYIDLCRMPGATDTLIDYKAIRSDTEFFDLHREAAGRTTAEGGLTARQIQARCVYAMLIDALYAGEDEVEYFGSTVRGRSMFWLGVGRLEINNNQQGEDLHRLVTSVMCHELFHLLGLAGTTLPDGTDLRGDDGSYEAMGWHCARMSNNCLMYSAVERDDSVVRTTLCPQCKDVLRGRDLARLPTTSVGGWT